MLKTQAPPGHILTYQGTFVNPLNVKPEDIDLFDIAHALSNLCRYNGHVSSFYSVAQHSVIVANQFEPKSYLKKWALFHDASEAYLGDVVAPLKYSGNYDFYLEAEENLMNAVCDRFDLGREQPEEVNFVDKKLRGAEMRDLKNYFPEASQDTYSFKIVPWLPERAKLEFLLQAHLLGEI